MSARDDFTKPTILSLGERVGYVCSNPNCLRVTVGPNSAAEKSTKTGIAAHIKGAASGLGSVRYDASQTSAERKHITNGIWLCAVCARKIDVDPLKYTVEIIHEWKRVAEELAAERHEQTVAVIHQDLDEIQNISADSQSAEQESLSQRQQLIIKELDKRYKTIDKYFDSEYLIDAFKLQNSEKFQEAAHYYAKAMNDVFSLIKEGIFTVPEDSEMENFTLCIGNVEDMSSNYNESKNIVIEECELSILAIILIVEYEPA